MATIKYRKKLRKYLAIAVLNYNASYYTSLGYEPTRVFQG